MHAAQGGAQCICERKSAACVHGGTKCISGGPAEGRGGPGDEGSAEDRPRQLPGSQHIQPCGACGRTEAVRLLLSSSFLGAVP